MRLAVLQLVGAFLLSACAFNQSAAPIRDASHKKPSARPTHIVTATPQTGYVVVQPGDNLYRIAFDHGLDYRQLAEWNGIVDPNIIRVGERLRLTPPETSAPAGVQPPSSSIEVQELPPLKLPSNARGKPIDTTKTATVSAPPTSPPAVPAPSVPEPPPVVQAEAKTEAPSNWVWPAKGQVITAFNEKNGAKGIDIAGKRGSPVNAAASGRVIYVGAGLRGYGKLIIIKHSNIVLSAYGHNDKVFVKEGQNVQAGQTIAEMGDTDSSRVKLHFEIREYGKPVDPRLYLEGGPG